MRGNFEPIDVELPNGLKMRARLYAGGNKTPVICIPGLTRNSADFTELAPMIANLGHNVVALSLRGRGQSDYDPDYLNYNPAEYRNDVIAALDQLAIPTAIFVGTSLGGIVTMLIAETAADRISAAIINDVGPELAPEGLARIAGYVGKNAGPAKTIEEATSRIRAINQVAFPDAESAEWEKWAHRTFRQNDDGDWILDYDPNIARALAEVGPGSDLWSGWAALKEKPTLLVRGELSDLLSKKIVDLMRGVHPNFGFVEAPRIGHAPFMTEPAAWVAVERFLKSID